MDFWLGARCRQSSQHFVVVLAGGRSNRGRRRGPDCVPNGVERVLFGGDAYLAGNGAGHCDGVSRPGDKRLDQQDSGCKGMGSTAQQVCLDYGRHHVYGVEGIAYMRCTNGGRAAQPYYLPNAVPAAFGGIGMLERGVQ